MCLPRLEEGCEHLETITGLGEDPPRRDGVRRPEGFEWNGAEACGHASVARYAVRRVVGADVDTRRLGLASDPAYLNVGVPDADREAATQLFIQRSERSCEIGAAGESGSFPQKRIDHIQRNDAVVGGRDCR